MELVQNHKKLCTHCGQCLDVCPMYEDLGLIERLYAFLETGVGIEPEDLSSCLTCGLCAEACPEGLGLKRLISPARKKLVAEMGLGTRQTMVDPAADNNIFKKILEMGGLSKVPEYKSGPAPVVYFPGCAANYINTSMSKATVALLEEAGVDYSVLSGLEYCCGAVSAGAGNPGPLQRNAKKNLDELKRRGAKILVTACPGCFKAFKDIYPRVFGEPDFEVLQISQYLERLIQERKLILRHPLKHRVFYHDPCHLTRGLGVYREARAVLEAVPGTELANKSPEGSACCGFGGGVRASAPDKSLAIASGRHKAAKALGCDLIITNCGGCMQNLTEAGAESEEELEVVDLAEYLARAFGKNIKREDRKMLEEVNKAYSLCLQNYILPDKASNNYL
ncbi:MAG: (Fe-S)-binding protein [Methanosarcinaceae archaeon]|nr:(Fe-S)-binding protein [Methanosarcinaceae archaeon]